ncbi:Hypothetical predicted protein, partial [Marmota monax]
GVYTSGITELWVERKPIVKRSLNKGHLVGTEVNTILGQVQDLFDGGFDADQFGGRLGDVNM